MEAAQSLEMPVVCHDYRNVLTGTLRDITESGAEIVAETRSSGPLFPQKTQVLLNLFDERTGRSVNVQARLTRAQRSEGTWVYRIRWKSLPEFLALQASLDTPALPTAA